MSVHPRSRPGELDHPSPDMGRTESDEENGFLNDGDLVIDRLPQPYRTIDKIVIKVFNQAWEEIEAREEERIERNKHHQADCVYANETIEILSECSTMCFSPDSQYIFASMFSGELLVLSADDHECVCKLQADDMDPSCLDFMECVSIGPDQYLLACIDDMGFAKLYIFSGSSICFVQKLNEQLEGTSKTNAEKFNMDADGDFAGLVLRMDDKCWLNFYKLPKDVWLNEINAAEKARQEELLNPPKPTQKRPGSGSNKSAKESASVKDNAGISSEVVATDVINSKPLDVSFAPVTLVLKINQPSKIEGNHYPSYKEAFEHASCSFGIGAGESHLFTESHLKLRWAAIKKQYAKEMKNFDPNQATTKYSPSWHFLKSSKLQPRLCLQQNGSVAALVWWSNSYDTHMYSLNHQRNSNTISSSRESPTTPEVVWPMCDLIESSAVSRSTVQVAIGMRNGTITVIDRQECFPLCALSVRPGIGVRKISFLDSNTDDTQLLVSMADGGVSLVSCSKKSCRSLTPNLGSGDFELQLLCSLPPLKATNHFICASSLDRLQIYDTNKDLPICDLVFSDSLEEAHDRFWCTPNGSRIYAKNDDATVSSIRLDQLKLLNQVFQLSEPTSVDNKSFKDQMKDLLFKRTKLQQQRTLLFRERWFEMAQELQTAN